MLAVVFFGSVVPRLPVSDLPGRPLSEVDDPSAYLTLIL
jgi:hypothetical protein